MPVSLDVYWSKINLCDPGSLTIIRIVAGEREGHNCSE
jgi:hypothetical protein